MLSTIAALRLEASKAPGVLRGVLSACWISPESPRAVLVQNTIRAAGATTSVTDAAAGTRAAHALTTATAPVTPAPWSQRALSSTVGSGSSKPARERSREPSQPETSGERYSSPSEHFCSKVFGQPPGRPQQQQPELKPSAAVAAKQPRPPKQPQQQPQKQPQQAPPSQPQKPKRQAQQPLPKQQPAPRQPRQQLEGKRRDPRRQDKLPPSLWLRLRGLPFETTKADIRRLFEGYKILDMVIGDRCGYKVYGEAFIQLDSVAAAVTAKRQLEAAKLKGQDVKLTFTTKEDYAEAKEAHDDSVQGFVVKCDGLPYMATEQDILKFLGPEVPVVGGVEGVLIKRTPRGTGLGQAWVEVCDAAAQMAALSKDKKRLMHRYVVVRRSTRKQMLVVRAEGERQVAKLKGSETRDEDA